MKEVSTTRKKKYKRNKETKYGSINKGFTQEELDRFLSVCKNNKAKLAFKLMAYLGLRIGEVVKIKVEDISFEQNTIRISTEKAHTGDLLCLHQGVQILLKEWVQILPSLKTNYLLYSKRKDRSCVSPHWLRKKFREYCKAAGLNEWYDHADDNRCTRKLHRLTTHSLRHYYITRVYGHSKNPLHTQRLARHRSFKSTQTYINVSQPEVDKTLRDVFNKNGLEGEDVTEFVRFYHLWKKMKK